MVVWFIQIYAISFGNQNPCKMKKNSPGDDLSCAVKLEEMLIY